MEDNRTSHTDVLDHEQHDRDDREQITVWDPDGDGCVALWLENEDGECLFSLHPDERRRLATRLMEGLNG